MIIRKATLDDVNALLRLAVEQAKRQPKLLLDREKVKRLIIECISSAACFAEVVEDDSNQVAGGLLALTGANLWAERKFSAILLWVSKVAGAGARLLRRFAVWVGGRRAIRMAGISKDIDWDDRIDALLIRVGFHRCGGNFFRYN